MAREQKPEVVGADADVINNEPQQQQQQPDQLAQLITITIGDLMFDIAPKV